MKAIGGYFQLEINNLGSIFHDEALALNTGRNALEYILLYKKVKHIFIPYFTCDAILEPLRRLEISYTYYNIDVNFYPCLPSISKKDTLLYTNYFGICSDNVNKLLTIIDNLIVDNAQAFYDKPKLNIPTFYSPRKFFGLPDGGFVYNCITNEKISYNQDFSHDRLDHLISRIEQNAEVGYLSFKENEKKLIDQPIKLMSKLTRKLMIGIDYESIRQQRLRNFYFFHEKLNIINILTNFIDAAVFQCPLIYPLWNKNGEVIRRRLLENKIFTAIYWPNVLSTVSDDTLEFDLSNNIVCLPIDQRLSIEDINFIIEIINE